MAFDNANLSGPFQSIAGPSTWIYKSDEVLDDVDATDFFVRGGPDYGMKVGDRVVVIDTTTPLVTDTWVNGIDADGNATVLADA
jgi:hypothetical protein